MDGAHDALLARLRARAHDPERRLELRPSEFGAWVESLDTDQLLDVAAQAQAQLARLLDGGPEAALDPEAQALAARLASSMERPAVGALPAVATEAEVAAAEAEMGVTLPPLLRCGYLEVANGGFGPGYGIVGVDGGWTDRGLTLAELHRSFRRPDPFGGDEWPPALVPLAHLGDGAYACVDAASLTAEIVVFDPAGPGDELVPAGQSLEEWLRGWLDR